MSALTRIGSGRFLPSEMHFDNQCGALMSTPEWMEGIAKDLLHAVLAEHGDQSLALGGGLQRVDGFWQIEFAGVPEQRAGLGAGDEDVERARPGGRLLRRLTTMGEVVSAAVMRARSKPHASRPATARSSPWQTTA